MSEFLSLVLETTEATHARAPSVEWVQRAVCRRYGISLPAMLSWRRAQRLVFPRHIAIWLLHKTTRLSLPQIARHFDDRDHTTIMHAISRIDEMMARNPAFHEEMQSLRLALTTGKVI